MTQLYIPVETAARELDAKLLLALFAVDAGMHVTVGNRALLNSQIHRFPSGIYLSHNFDKGRQRILSILHRLGHRIAAWDEEGLVWIDGKTYRRRRVHSDTLRHVDCVYAWGAQHAEVLGEAVKNGRTRIVRSGNPRADLLRPEFRALYSARAEALRAELGDFILINSNFGWLNYALAETASMYRSDEELEVLAERARHPLGYMQHRYRVFRAICDVLPELSKRFAKRKIIIRPHPSEHAGGWREAARGCANVDVRYDSDLIPWLMAAGSIVHNGCTTAVEAALLQRIPIMYRPVDGGEFEIRQPLAVSAEARDDTALFRMIAEQKVREGSRQTVRNNLTDMVEGWDHGLSAERIAADLVSLNPVQRGPAAKLNRIIGICASSLRAVEKLASGQSRKSPSNPDYVGHKFPEISANQIGERGFAPGQMRQPACTGRQRHQRSDIPPRSKRLITFWALFQIHCRTGG